MSRLNEIISEIKTKIKQDSDIDSFCTEKYAKSITVKSGDHKVLDVPIKQIPVAIVSDAYDERQKRRFLYSDCEANLLVTCGILQNDIEKAAEELIAFKELIKLSLKKDPLLNGKASYSTVIKSRKLKVITHPLYFMEMTLYVNYKE